MKIVVSGSSGMIGSALCAYLEANGHEVIRLVRRTPQQNEIAWDPAEGMIEAKDFEGVDAVVHLGGESIAAGRWTPAKKKRIRDSRVQSTRLLSETLATMETPPKVLVVASAIGYYGDRGATVVDEGSDPGSGFLSDVCCEWEAASKPAEEKGIRVVRPRIGMVLSKTGGALDKMLLPFKMGVGGILGNGHQYVSWIDIDDLVSAILFLIEREEMSGCVNVVSPRPLTNHDFTKALGHALHRPTLLPMPAFAARLAFGEMGDALLLASTKVQASRLMAAGYPFKYPEIEKSLNHLLKQ